MRTSFAELIARPAARSPWFSLVLCLALAPSAAQATDPVYINYGTITEPPVIDAFDFINYGTFNISTIDPFETSSTRNYTNYGSMMSTIGWRFGDSPASSGYRTTADNFVNENQGIVGVPRDFANPILIGVPAPSPFAPNYLFVNATNIVNKGLLSVGANGWLRLTGSHIDLTRGGVRVAPIGGIGSANVGTNFYIPDGGIADNYWGGTNASFGTGGIWNGTRATSPGHPVQGGQAFASVTVRDPMLADSYLTLEGIGVDVTNLVETVVTNAGGAVTNLSLVTTNIFFPTNEYRQAVFVGIGDPSRQTVGIRWSPSSSPTNRFQTVAVQLVIPSEDVVTLGPANTTLYFYDEFASETNRGMLGNAITGSGQSFGGMRPANYVLSRVDDGRYAFGTGGNNGVPEPRFLYDPDTFTNSFVDGEYAAYSAFIGNQVSTPAPVVGGTVTNIPGRLQINADTLNLTDTRMRGEGEIRINAKHLTGSQNAVVDCENVSFSLTSTNGMLQVASLAKENVDRVKGFVYAWSGLWSNTVTYVYTNNWTATNDVDTNGVPTSTNYIQVPITNSSSANLYALIFDTSRLLTRLPVRVWDFDTHSTNVVVDDNMTVIESLLIDSERFTLNGRLTLSSFVIGTTLGGTIRVAIDDWVYTNAPRVMFFTNNGILQVPNNAHFGDDRGTPYSAFVNTGTLDASSISFKANALINQGDITARNALRMDCVASTFENGSSSARSTELFSGDVRFNGYRMTSTLKLTLAVTNALWDAGGQTANAIVLTDGINMLRKPATGDLLGTSLETSAPNFAQVDHRWAGEDRGVNTAGYLNNIALGKLVVKQIGLGNPLLAFRGATANNAIYVDQIDLTAAGTNIDRVIRIDPGMVIYYAAARIGFTPPPGPNNIVPTPEEYLDGRFNGRLKWVSAFTGPNSSVAVLVDGKTVIMNSGLRNSRTIDSDNDGIPNFSDTTPLGGASANSGSFVLSAALAAKAGQGASKGFAITWTAAANSVYEIESATDLLQPQWQPFQRYTNASPTSKSVTIWDMSAPAGVAQRFYRVGISPE